MKVDQNFIKKENQNLVLELIQAHELISRAHLAKITHMSPTSISRIVASLINIGLIRETENYSSGVGRKAKMLTVVSESLTSVGVEVEEKYIRVGLFDFLGQVLTSRKKPKALNESPETVVTTIKETVAELLEKENVELRTVTGVCVGMPGFINNIDGIVHKSAQLGWENVNFKTLLEEALNFHIYVDNELKLKAYAEQSFEKNKLNHTMSVIGFGSGVGSALIIGENIYRGHLNSAGEIGHTVVDPNGELCTCGNFGCIQTYIAEGFLLKEAQKHASVKNITEIIDCANLGERWAGNILDRATTYAAITVNNSVCLNNPDKVILTGALIEEYPEIREEIIEKSKKNIWEPLKDSVEIEVSELGDKGVILGAALLSQAYFVNELDYEKELN